MHQVSGRHIRLGVERLVCSPIVERNKSRRVAKHRGPGCCEHHHHSAFYAGRHLYPRVHNNLCQRCPLLRGEGDRFGGTSS